jgi:hypothetical protein
VLANILRRALPATQKKAEYRRQETGDRRQETGDRRQETGDRRQETGDRRQETGDRRQDNIKSKIKENNRETFELFSF